MRHPAGTLEASEGPWTNLPTLLNRRPLVFPVGPLGVDLGPVLGA